MDVIVIVEAYPGQMSSAIKVLVLAPSRNNLGPIQKIQDFMYKKPVKLICPLLSTEQEF